MLSFKELLYTAGITKPHEIMTLVGIYEGISFNFIHFHFSSNIYVRTMNLFTLQLLSTAASEDGRRLP